MTPEPSFAYGLTVNLNSAFRILPQSTTPLPRYPPATIRS